VTDEEIADALAHLEATGFVHLYTVGTRRYGAIPNWKRHQPVPPSRFTPSNHPPAPPQADRKQGAGTRPRARKHDAGDPQADASSRAGSHTGARAPKGIGREGEMEGESVRADAREQDPDDLSDDVVARVELLTEAFDGEEGPLARRLRGDERPVLLGWAQLARAGTLVPLDEIVQLARRLLDTPTKEGTRPATLRFIEPTVQTLARAPANGSSPNGLSPEMQAMVDRVQARQAQGGTA
jgi:hypothetical protein